MISTGYISYTRLFAPCTLPLDQTKTKLVNELCNLLKGSHIMWKKLKTLSRPTGCILNAQNWQLQAWLTPHVLCCTLCSPPWHLRISSLLHRSQSPCWQCGTGALAHANSHGVFPALLCLQSWWSSFQPTVTAAVPCASYTNLLHAPDLHFPKRTHNFVQLTECIHSLTWCGVVSDMTEAEFLRSA